jgi:hypothetical protein
VDLTYLLIAAAILVLPTILTRLFSGDSGDTQKVLGAWTPARTPGLTPARGASLRERVHALVAQRRITEAVKLVQSAGNLPLEKAQEIVATIQRADAAQSRKANDRPLSPAMRPEARRLVAQGRRSGLPTPTGNTGMGPRKP